MVISCVGDIGDSVVLLGILSQLEGGPHKLLLTCSNETKMKTPADVARWCELFKPLAESQRYVEQCRVLEADDHVDWASGGFRGSGLHSRSASLFNAQLSHLIFTRGLGHNISPNQRWIEVEALPDARGRVVCARSGRYRNGSFPWRKIVRHYGDKLLFIGLPHEHRDFSGEFGLVEHRPVADLLEMARVIAGSELFIGNQSSPMAIAEGLKHPTIQETSIDPADCIYLRANAQWVDNGACVLPAIGDTPELSIAPSVCLPTDVLTHTTPPGLWQVNGLPPVPTFDQAVKLCAINGVKQPDGITLEDWIKAQNALRAPEFFFGEAIYANTKNTEAARRNAGFPPRTVRQMIGL